MNPRWRLDDRASELAETLLQLAETDYPAFLSRCIKVKVPYARQRKPDHFRFRDVHSYNYAALQERYRLAGEVNASLIEHKRDFIAMEYPTDRGVASTSELVVRSQSRVVISLIGERYHWESDFMRGHFAKTAVYRPVDLAAWAERAGVAAGREKYPDALEILREQNDNFTVECHLAKKGTDEAEGEAGGDRSLSALSTTYTVFRINCLCWKDKTPPGASVIKALDVLHDLCRQLAEQENTGAFPTITHCLAGVGRTGTFVFYHMFSEALRDGEVTAENQLRAFIGLFLYLRSKRTWMIEVPQQLDFLFQAFFGRPGAARGR